MSEKVSISPNHERAALQSALHDALAQNLQLRALVEALGERVDKAEASLAQMTEAATAPQAVSVKTVE